MIKNLVLLSVFDFARKFTLIFFNLKNEFFLRQKNLLWIVKISKCLLKDLFRIFKNRYVKKIRLHTWWWQSVVTLPFSSWISRHFSSRNQMDGRPGLPPCSRPLVWPAATGGHTALVKPMVNVTSAVNVSTWEGPDIRTSGHRTWI